MANSSPLTLTFDCGGGGIKASVLSAGASSLGLSGDAVRIVGGPIRTPTPYPLPPDLLVETFTDLAERLPDAERVTVGMPGMIRDGRVIATPHYITKSGPRSKILPSLRDAWSGFDMRGAVKRALGIPALVLNDAEVAGAGVIGGKGLEMIITLGTGLGNAVFLNGVLAPHAEISQGLVRWGMTYDDYLGEHERLRLGDHHWSRRARRVIEGFEPVYLWDMLYVGGGNAKRITDTQRARMPAKVAYVPNETGMLGGLRAWDLIGSQ